MSIDLNADIGEGLPAADDEALLDVVTSANVACGVHAGDPAVMARTVAACVARGVAIGAHPGYADREGFGRRLQALAPAAVEALVHEQIAALASIARDHDAVLTHVKPHGALYNQAASDDGLALAIARGIARSGALAFVGLATSGAMRRAAASCGLRFVGEAFADRRYLANGSLQSRGDAGAVLEDARTAAAQALAIARDGFVEATDGTRLPVAAETLCLHGDRPGAARLARHVRGALEAAGIRVAPLSS